ncbi:MAG: hypothetical protein ACI85F_002186 [Bacteroidia bacterium]
MEKSAVTGLLEQLKALASDGEGVYPTGSFPSQRYHPFLPYSREDDNLFFTATVAYTLKSHLDLMSDAERELANSIIEAASSIIPLFRNKGGKPTYNFWQTKPSRHFPNGLFMRKFEHFRIPDDADDTALAHLLVNHSEKEVHDLTVLFSSHANLSKKPIENTWSEFKELGAISTFFGEKMRIEFDAVVMCNALLFLKGRNVEESIVEDSIAFIDGVIENGYHLSAPFYAAANYPKPDLIIYHVARLIRRFPQISLSKHREKLVRDLDDLLATNLPHLNQLVAVNAKLLLGVQELNQAESSLDAKKVVNDSEGYFFHAGMLSAFENSLAQNLSKNSLFHFRYRCKALNIAMLIEHELLRRSP